MAAPELAPGDQVPHLDLRGTPCPLNFIRSRLALESLPPGAWLQIDLDQGEPEEMVVAGLRQAGHQVQVEQQPGLDAGWVRLQVCRG